MGVEQIYNPMTGINRMITDIENSLEPFWFSFHPILHMVAEYNLYILSGVLCLLIFYTFFIKKHGIIRKFRERDTYIFMVAGVLLFVILNRHPIPVGPKIKFNIGLAVLPMIAKFLGPFPSFIFGIVQYFIQFLMTENSKFGFAGMFMGMISGLLYAIFLYDKKTKYTRCFLVKLMINILCNMILAPHVKSDVMTVELAKNISGKLIENIFMVPFQALAIYILLKVARKLKMRFLT